MSNSKAPSPLRAADFEAIESALMESARGRWFLAEFAERNRSADTRMLLDAISKLETTILQPQTGAHKEHIRRDLIEMAEAISRTRREIAAMRSADDADSNFTLARGELGAVVEATEKATSDILEAAEDIQETAWQLREQGVDDEACNRLDGRATDIYTACSFQDLTGQRTEKVVQTLRFLEKRMLAMIDIWGIDDVGVRETGPDGAVSGRRLLNGPARNGEGVEQVDIDAMMETEAAAARAPEPEDTAQRNEEVPTERVVLETEPPLTCEVDAEDFTAPPELDIEDLDESKTEALFI